MIRQILGTSRFLVIFAVLGSFITSAVLMVYGLLRSIGVIGDLLENYETEEIAAKALIVDAATIVDIFLLGTVLFIIAAGLYQLFVDADLPLPHWLVITTIEDLKARLAGVIVVGMIVAFLGYVVDWDGGTDIVAPGIAIAAVVIAIAVYFRLTRPEHT